MADDFDLLETASSEKSQEKVDVNWGKTIDQMKSRLSQEQDPQTRQKILNATLDDVVKMAETDRSTLLDAIKDLTDYQDEVGIIFEKFSSLNAEEQKVIDDAQKALERAKIELEDAENVKDTWWNNLFGRKSRIKKKEEELKEAQKTRDAADNKAKAMFQERIESADVQTLLGELSYKSQAAVTRLKNREVEIKEVEDRLQDAIVEASKNHTKALEKKAETEEKLEEQYALLKQARQALEEVTDKQSTQYSEAIGKVTQIEQKVEELEGLRNAYITLAASKDSFVHKHNLTIKVLTSLRSNLQTHRAKLKSDTEERLKYYDGYIVALKARTDQEFAAILEHLGVKTDEHIGETLASMHTASAKARQSMMDNIPVHEKVMKGVYGSYAEALQEIREKDATIRQNFADRYGIDMKELFEEYYADDKKQNPTPETPKKPSEPDTSGDDLLS
ncbi:MULTISPECIES: microtubule-binding protein [Croceibacter]|jgi:DNA repair exonuclease SbcCD ATPase subunit|uniref:microtubule-binding protein n=1 Tax=Croceibacter TaxID=216431 RepID=UPI000C5CA51F|nr:MULTISPECIES: microtubule-binding protein [Croceibacter]MAM22193.1 microtubule-binding protein [Croceibacter sp.]MBG26406.1 microtubule-binding protein [Croceibacter sp.]WSP33707.1 microtubule-binding protein [Croceibacter atlanticus]|tara:strand:- start:1258 stop:2601 length:1344 start_codon:yes stop_codon:yes gene_type:complete